MDEARATHARAAASGGPGSRASRARDRRGRVVGDEQHRLRGSLGWLIYSQRSARGWSQARLAEETGCTETTVRELERGQVRPSDAMTRKLGRALESGRGELAAAVADLRLQRAAGASLRPLNRRRPPRMRTLRLYATAAALLDDEQARQAQGRSEFLDMLAAEFADPEPVRDARGSPADVWPDRWPRTGR